MYFNQAKRGCRQENKTISVSLNWFQGLAQRMKQGNPLYKLRLRLDAETSSAILYFPRSSSRSVLVRTIAGTQLSNHKQA